MKFFDDSLYAEDPVCYTKISENDAAKIFVNNIEETVKKYMKSSNFLRR